MDKAIRPLGFILATAIFLAFVLRKAEDKVSFNSERFFDSLADSGLLLHSEQDRAELIEMRTLVVAGDVNARLSANLISKLLILNHKSDTLPIDIFLRTEGGWEADAFAAAEVIRGIGAPVNIHAVGEVHSSGLILLAAATGRRIAYEQTIFGFHALDGDEKELNARRYEGFFRSRTRLPDQWLKNREGEFFYFSASDAIKYGLADEIRQNRPLEEKRVAAENAD